MDLSGTIFESTIRRPRGARRFSMDSHQGKFRVKSPVLPSSRSTFHSLMFPKDCNTSPPMSFDSEWRDTRQISLPWTTGSVLDSILEKEGFPANQRQDAITNTSRVGSRELQRALTTAFDTSRDMLGKDRLVIADRDEPSKDMEPQRLLPWER